MNTTPTTPKRTKRITIDLRNAADPSPIPLRNYALPLETFLSITGEKKSRNKLWYHHTIRFKSFIGQTLTLTITHEKEIHTLTLLIHSQQLTVSCSCQSSVTTLCIHAYEYLFNVARIGGDYAFIDFAPNGIIETALAHKPYFTIQYTGKHGILARLKNSPGRIYQLENNWVTSMHLQAYNQLPGREENFVIKPQSNDALCYLLMSSPRHRLAPFILPCVGILNKEGKGIKSFKNYITGAEESLGSVLSNDELPRIKACTEIMKKSEAAPGLVNLDEEKESETLAALFRLFKVSLPLFREAMLYVHPYYSKKRLGNRPVKTYAWQAAIAADKPTLRFRLHNKGSYYQFTLSIWVNGKALANHQLIASFFIASAKGTTLYMFASLRDAGITFWMEQNKGLITVFSNHFPAFNRDILEPLRQHYPISETGKKKPQS